MRSIKISAAVWFALSSMTVAQQHAPSVPAAPAVLNKDTEVRLVLSEAVSSATAKNGQMVRMAVAEDVVSNGVIVIPKGTPATGEIVQARMAVPKKQDGYFDIRPMHLTLPGGARVALRESPSDACEPDGPCWLLRALTLPLLPAYLIHDAAEKRHHPEEGKDYVKQPGEEYSGYVASVTGP